MSYMQRTYFYFVLCYLLTICGNFVCECREVSRREAKNFYETGRDPYLSEDDYGSNHVRKDDFEEDSERKNEIGKRKEVEENRLPWRSAIASSADVSKDEKTPRNSDFGETEKIVTVRVSSSVARSTCCGGRPNYVEKPKLAALQRIGFDVEEPGPRTTVASSDERRLLGYVSFPPHRNVPQEIWLGPSTESSRENADGYYETRIEAVSSHREIVFGKSDRGTGTSTSPPPETAYAYYPPRDPERGYAEISKKRYELPETNYELPEMNYEVPEKNYEVDDESGGDSREGEPGEGSKLGYVMDGRNFRKYRVEERTPDGFIVGEYGFVRHEDGKLHGVRYTADGAANPRLIYDALLKFLSL